MGDEVKYLAAPLPSEHRKRGATGLLGSETEVGICGISERHSAPAMSESYNGTHHVAAGAQEAKTNEPSQKTFDADSREEPGCP